MTQAKILSEKELKRALGILMGQRHEKRNRLALLLTHWAGMRVCEVAALTLGDIIDVTGGIVEEIRLTGDQTKGDKGRVVYLNNKIRKEIRDYIERRDNIDPTNALLISQKARYSLRYSWPVNIGRLDTVYGSCLSIAMLIGDT